MRLRLLAVVLLAASLVAPAAEAAQSKNPKTSRKAPASFAVSVARFESLESGGTMRLEGGGEYRGTLELRRGPAGVGAVNEVPFEDYLKGIAEVPNGWPVEALRAQAIAARTYALYVLEGGLAGSAGDLAAQICATEGCQVYAGTAKEQAPKGENWSAAVEATKGQVLLHQGKAVQAKYSSSNGGRSVAGGKPYLKAADDPDDAKSPLHRWTLDLSFEDLGRALAVPGPVEAVSRDTNGGIVVSWTGAAQGQEPGSGQSVVSPPDLRSKVNTAVPPIPPPPGRSRTVPSHLFNLTVTGRTVHLDGRGYGHGIGMSQWGAYGKAQRGMKAAAILASYYGGIKPTTPPPGRLPDTVRVAVDPGRPELVVSSAQPFKVRDADGKVVSEVASGAWKVVPGGKGLRLLPPAGQGGPAAVEVLGIDPPTPAIGQPATIRFRSTVPALVSALVHPPGGVETQLLSAHPTGNEELSVTLPPAQAPGPYLVWLTAEAGAGRSATQPLMPLVADPTAAASAPKWTPPGAKPDRPLASRVSRSSAVATPAERESVASATDRWPAFAALTGAGLLVLAIRARRSRFPKAPPSASAGGIKPE